MVRATSAAEWEHAGEALAGIVNSRADGRVDRFARGGRPVFDQFLAEFMTEGRRFSEPAKLRLTAEQVEMQYFVKPHPRRGMVQYLEGSPLEVLREARRQDGLSALAPARQGRAGPLRQGRLSDGAVRMRFLDSLFFSFIVVYTNKNVYIQLYGGMKWL